MSRLLCLDFDGVIHSYTSGWQGADVANDPAVPGAIEFIKSVLADSRFRLAVFSARSGQSGGVMCMKMYLRDAGLSVKQVETIEWPTSKPPAFLTVDDRAVRFTGIFPDIEWIHTFRPWNKP